ncbi:enoyl-CoA hydratase/isomerase family protein [Sinorhizobium meliloti]|uniref:enoyl-CoA hydratase/isomerase family protein n=1 Tax=Rhizobium meliloti TaxID=382 RepID=UPI000B49F535|nr:enoyl-CoA hydratase/isomerase family protein [Sinorhizobium meliloti]ASP55678.1 enoyl-CoA hydratase/isomerase family protein [Sinorhizobium meliloti]ASP94548.1 enoyl-CoA hydratase/isomerase family protein [Sinorhizobium meliloti]MDX0192554.1 enoyl-CoA hydratase/isomerase family protein [Sinorhizobium meliloti]MQX58059.1 enoyl-CoA hydratase/isomerase family protein [Sinorhizobium meliloti]
MEMQTTLPEVIVERQGAIGRLRLNRPRALNSVNRTMIRAIAAALTEFERDPGIAAVLVTGEGERGLCAGGDIRMIYESGRERPEEGAQFWREEFIVNSRISAYSKPYIAIMDGIVMGGGVGVSSHGSHRIVTERTRFAMPETGIGYFTDVGATWLLPRAPGEFGTYLGLTGRDIGAAAVIHARLADSFVPSERIGELLAALSSLSATATADDVSAAIRVVSSEPPASALLDHLSAIDRCFAFNAVEEIFAALEKDESDFARETLELLKTRSAISLKLTLSLLRAGRSSATLNECLEREYAATLGMLSNPDFYEGVRAAVIDKDRNPKWSVELSEATPDLLARFGRNDGAALFAGKA